MTRDSRILKVLLLLSVVLGVLSTITDPSLYGLDPVRGKILLNRIQLLSAIIAAVTGYLQTSPLKGENDSQQIKPRSVLLPFLLVTAGMAASGCSFIKQPVTPTVPVITEAEQAKVRELSTKALAGIEVAGIVVRDARQMVEDLADARAVPASVLEVVNAAVRKANPIVQQLITEIAAATREVTIKGLIAQAVAAIEILAAVLEAQTDPRVKQAGVFVRGAIGGVAALAGVR
jgi:hypothetical protein